MSDTVYELGSYQFESRETFEQAQKEYKIIMMLQEKVDLTDSKAVLKVYNRFVSEKTFRTVIGYAFLGQLRQALIDGGIVTKDGILPIPIKESQKRRLDTMPSRPKGESKYKKLYERQKIVSAKFKIALIALCVFVIGVVGITVKTKYSVFTYFTNYKQNMEDEIIDKYEKWETDLQTREDALKK